MAVTQVDIDDATLSEAMRLSGSRTKKEIVNLALRAYVDGQRRLEALEHHARTAESWDHAGWLSLREQEKAAGA